MTTRTVTSRHLVAPVVLIGMAVMVPLAVAAEPVGVTESRSGAATARASERGDRLVEIVSEAARQLCGIDAAVVPAADSHVHLELRPTGRVVVPADFPAAAVPPLSHHLLDLPPPRA